MVDTNVVADSSAGCTPGGAAGDVLRFANPPQVLSEGQLREKLPREDVGMPYTPATKRALRLSFEAHRNQRDKSGLPYVYHPFHLAEQMPDEATACAALLHDTVEDGHLTFAQLEEADIPAEAIEAVRALTHDLKVPYLRYVLGLRTQPVARVVKLADLRHNANLSRLDKPTDKDRRRRVKYLMAQALLDDSHDTYDCAQGQWRKRIPLDGVQPHEHYLSVYYLPDGTWEKLSLDEDLARSVRYVFDARLADALRRALGMHETLPEALADVLDRGGIEPILAIMREQGMPYQTLLDA